MHRALTVLSLCLLTGCPDGPPAQESTPAKAAVPADSPAALADRVARAAGLEAWSRVSLVSFTFAFPDKKVERRYAWDVPKGLVEVTLEPNPENVRWVVAPAGFGPDDAPAPEQQKAHETFVNDSFWALPCLHLAWDRSVLTLEDLGSVDVPTLPDLGKRRALAAHYDAKAGGYTPGDRYVFYLGDDDFPVAWAFHRQGSAEPTFVAEWREAKTVEGLRIATHYVGGPIDLRIEGVRVEAGPAATQPTSRPTGGR